LADNTSVARVTYANYVGDYDAEEDGMGGVDTLADSMAELSVEDDSSKDKSTVLWDMTRPLVGNVSKLEFLKFEDDVDARTVFWHSSAHVMGEALERLFGSRLTIGPPLAGGFYYDSYMGGGEGDGAFKEEDCECCCCLFGLV
jgi:threonyl-tRNA synthetase